MKAKGKRAKRNEVQVHCQQQDRTIAAEVQKFSQIEAKEHWYNKLPVVKEYTKTRHGHGYTHFALCRIKRLPFIFTLLLHLPAVKLKCPLRTFFPFPFHSFQIITLWPGAHCMHQMNRFCTACWTSLHPFRVTFITGDQSMRKQDRKRERERERERDRERQRERDRQLVNLQSELKVPMANEDALFTLYISLLHHYPHIHLYGTLCKWSWL